MMHRYVKLSMTSPDYTAMRAALVAAFEGRTGNTFSEVQNLAQTESWSKVWADTPAQIGGAVLDVQDGSNSRAMADMATPAWSSPAP